MQFLAKPIRKYGVAVPDLVKSAKEYARLFGAGPFFTTCLEMPVKHRGRSFTWKLSAACGQWGDAMVELLQSEGPSPLNDIVPQGQSGLHHVTFIVDDPERLAAEYAAAGFPVVLQFSLGDFDAYFVDVSSICGHQVQIYAPTEQLLGLYDFVKDQAKGWDGANPIRPMPLASMGFNESDPVHAGPS